MQPHLWKTQDFPQNGPASQKTEPIPATFQTFVNNKSLPVRYINFVFSNLPGSQVRQETKWLSSFWLSSVAYGGSAGAAVGL
jgi:hypothetical protein